jgi:hypothetical protein
MWWCDTSTSGMATSVIHVGAPPCASGCCIRFLHARGSNRLVRREHGKCSRCGSRFVRQIRWADRVRGEWTRTEQAA